MTSAHHTYAAGQLAIAARLALSQPTTYEGLYVACIGPIQRIDADHDLPRDQRLSFIQWRNRLLPCSNPPFPVSDLMAALRQRRPSEADDIALELAWIANQLATFRFHHRR